MMRCIEMMKGAKILVDVLGNVDPKKDKVLVVADTSTSPIIAELIASAAHERGAEVVICIMTPPRFAADELPASVAAAMKVADVIYAAVTPSIYHSKAREEACAKGARMIGLGGFTEDMLIHGPIEADFKEQSKIIKRVADEMTKANSAKMTAPGGTDICFSLKGRTAKEANGIAKDPGETKSPYIEVAIAPLEGSTEGIFVVDKSMSDIGVLAEPIKISVSQGYAIKIDGGSEASELRRLLEATGDPNAYNIAEFSLGMNPKARITSSSVQEHEAAYGTAHIALGKNTTLPGGKVDAPIHVDGVILKPTVWLDDKIIMRDGKLVS